MKNALTLRYTAGTAVLVDAHGTVVATLADSRYAEEMVQDMLDAPALAVAACEKACDEAHKREMAYAEDAYNALHKEFQDLRDRAAALLGGDLRVSPGAPEKIDTGRSFSSCQLVHEVVL